ncbi:MAG: SusD/RagB family nutrient-binding outer membrane lipoprotein, partial [Bacteroidia bacterium]|nr:SusD/RagB family nutrient-binding outer membrane lipoprotein [Bacteroidia bacterium]
IYPAGGEFDDDAFGNVGLGTGAGGFGIEPIFLSSYVDFMRADAALSMNMAGQAATYLESAMTKSIAKVQSFGANDPDADLSFEPSSDDVAAYIANTVAAFNSASGEDQWDVLGEQYFIAVFGGGTDAYNFYRRTGNPTTLQPNLEPNPGAFPRSFLYPSNEVIANPNIVQRTDNATQVFWDTNPAGPAFPPAN